MILLKSSWVIPRFLEKTLVWTEETNGRWVYAWDLRYYVERGYIITNLI